MGDCCNGQDFAAESMGVRSALWIVGILNALTFALKITAEIAPLDILRDAFIYGVAFYVVVSRLLRKGGKRRWYELPIEARGRFTVFVIDANLLAMLTAATARLQMSPLQPVFNLVLARRTGSFGTTQARNGAP
jgi:hypothetical protein